MIEAEMQGEQEEEDDDEEDDDEDQIDRLIQFTFRDIPERKEEVKEMIEKRKSKKEE
jgi:hypothetical protein